MGYRDRSKAYPFGYDQCFFFKRQVTLRVTYLYVIHPFVPINWLSEAVFVKDGRHNMANQPQFFGRCGTITCHNNLIPSYQSHMSIRQAIRYL